MNSLQQLGRAVKAAQYRHHLAAERALGAIGTTLPQWDALRAIAGHPGWSAHALAGETFMSDQAFGALANRLIAQGLVVRSPGRGRRVEHTLTDAGGAMLEAGNVVIDTVLQRSFGGMSEAERRTLSGLLDRVGVGDGTTTAP